MLHFGQNLAPFSIIAHLTYLNNVVLTHIHVHEQPCVLGFIPLLQLIDISALNHDREVL